MLDGRSMRWHCTMKPNITTTKKTERDSVTENLNNLCDKTHTHTHTRT